MLKPTINFAIYRCIHNFTHPNIGRLLTKGKLYVCSSYDPQHDIIQMRGYNGFGGACCSLDRFNYYFEYVRDIRKKQLELGLACACQDTAKYSLAHSQLSSQLGSLGPEFSRPRILSGSQNQAQFLLQDLALGLKTQDSLWFSKPYF